MPRAERQMTDDYSTIQASLEERLRELLERASEIEDDLSQPGDDDWAENASESGGDEVQSRVGQATFMGIERIRKALAAIRNGTYGKCAGCQKPISPERLEALPEATKCVRCA